MRWLKQGGHMTEIKISLNVDKRSELHRTFLDADELEVDITRLLALYGLSATVQSEFTGNTLSTEDLLMDIDAGMPDSFYINVNNSPRMLGAR